MLAAIRPDAWNLPLLLHVLGAMLLVGSLLLAGSALVLAVREGSAPLARTGFRSLLLGVLPAWILMRVGAGWIADKENLSDSSAAWIGMGFTTADGGLLFIVIATVLAGLAARRMTRSGRPGGGTGWAAAGLVGLLLLAYLFTVWAMTTKPA